MRVVPDRGNRPLSQEGSVRGLDEVVVGEAAAVIGQQAGRGDEVVRRPDPQLGGGSQDVSVDGGQLGLAAVAVGVLEGERARVERQRSGDAAGVQRQAALLDASAGAFLGSGAEVGGFPTPALLRSLDQLSNTRPEKVNQAAASLSQGLNVRSSTCSGGIGEDPLEMASRTGRSCGTVGMETATEAFAWCPTSAEQKPNQVESQG